MQQVAAPIATPESQDLWVALLRAADHAKAAVEQNVKAQGLPPLAWYDPLWALTRAPGHAMRPRDLAAQLLLTRYGVSRLIDRLEAEGLLQRDICEEDGRGQIVRITPAGLALREKMWPAYGAAMGALLESRFTPQEAHALTALLRKLA
ncbi:MAG: MarR family winged helix-turn-helix transcriptional regulator [Hyphomonadaceae bacterium]